MNTMEDTPLQTEMRQCPCCHRQLPLTEFYVNARTGKPDSRCKACRRQASRIQRGKSALGPRTETRRSYLVLTEVEDRELRMTLIRHALRVVAESVRRRREREAAMEDSK